MNAPLMMPPAVLPPVPASHALYRPLFSLLAPGGPKGRLSILLFHRVLAAPDPLVPEEVRFEQLTRVLDFLQANMTVLPLDAAITALKQRRLPPRAVALSFDDGYQDWLQTVVPALKQRDMPATFFISTEQLQGPALWHERILAAVRALPAENIRLPYGFGSYGDLRSPANRTRLVAELQERLKYVALPERMAAIAMLEAQAIAPLLLPERFDAAAVRALHSQGFGIGAHTQRHPILKECSRREAIAEIGGAREELEGIVRAPVTLFAYPNGRPKRDYDGEHVRIVKACGYHAAVATSSGAANADSDLFQLPRFAPWAYDELRLGYQLARNMLTRDTPVERAHLPRGTRTTPVRSLLIASTFPPIHGGSAVVYESLCLHMPAGSVRVLAAKENYLTGREIEGWREHDAKAPYPIDRVPLLRPRMLPPPANIVASAWRLLANDMRLYLSTLWRAAQLVRQHGINTICVGELVTGSWLGLALRGLFGCKVVIYVHGEEITTVTPGRLGGNRRADYLQAADKVVAVSSFTCDALTHYMGIRPEKIALIHNGVDTERFVPAAPAADLIARHGLQGKRIVLTVGRLVTRKGIDMAMRAIGQLRERVPNIHYLIVGDGENRAELEQIRIDEGLQDCVTFAGKATDEDLLRYFQLGELFLMPNRTLANGDTEGFGLVFREANACGKPVIGGRAGGVVEAVLDGETGLLVDGTDVNDIAAAVERILGDTALRERMGAQGLQLARDNSTRAMANQFLKVCERVLDRHPG